jgi:5-methylthioadenosine/S-adenosylhomocysteine deaminase
MHLARSVVSLLLLVMFSFAGCASAPLAQPGEPADILITGGTVVTISGGNIAPGSVAIRDGVIVAVGPSAEIDPRFAAAEVIDARGSAVLPGFVNAHTHAAMALFRGIADDRELMDWLENFIFPAEARNVDAEFVRWGTRLAAAEMIMSGTTTYADMYYFEADVARETRAAGLRGVLGETMIDFPAPDNKTWDEAVAYVRRFAEEFRGDPLITPALAPHAPYTVSEEHLRQVRALATELGIPILIHVAETEDEVAQIKAKTGKRPVEYLDSIGLLGPDVVAAHSVWLDEGEIGIYAARGVSAAHCPESNMMLASGVAPVTALRAAGIAVGIGTDGPAGSNNNLDMIEEMASAARLQKVSRRDPQALGARDVLRMATLEGARALGLDSKIGSIETGKRADVIIVSLGDVRTTPWYSVESAVVYSASSQQVRTTIVDGRVLMRDRKLLTIDIDATRARAYQYRDDILRSIAK